MKQKSIYRSIINLTCPKCRKGKLFLRSGLFRYKAVLNMPKKCAHCGQNYEIEPGFWIGALWASYPLIIIIEVPFLIAAISYEGINVWICFGLMLAAFILFYPMVLRLGRSIWIHVFVRYNPPK